MLQRQFSAGGEKASPAYSTSAGAAWGQLTLGCWVDDPQAMTMMVVVGAAWRLGSCPARIFCSDLLVPIIIKVVLQLLLLRDSAALVFVRACRHHTQHNTTQHNTT